MLPLALLVWEQQPQLSQHLLQTFPMLPANWLMLALRLRACFLLAPIYFLSQPCPFGSENPKIRRSRRGVGSDLKFAGWAQSSGFELSPACHTWREGVGEEVVFKGRFGNNFLNLTSCFSDILKGCQALIAVCSRTLLSYHKTFCLRWGEMLPTLLQSTWSSSQVECLHLPESLFLCVCLGLWKQPQYFGLRNKINDSIQLVLFPLFS